MVLYSGGAKMTKDIKAVVELIEERGDWMDNDSCQGFVIQDIDELATAIVEWHEKEIGILELELGFAQGKQGSELAMKKAIIEGMQLRIDQYKKDLQGAIDFYNKHKNYKDFVDQFRGEDMWQIIKAIGERYE